MLLLDDDDELPTLPGEDETNLHSRLGQEVVRAIDTAIVDHARFSWLKVARVIHDAISSSGMSLAQDRWFEASLAEAHFSVVEENGRPVGAIGVRDDQDSIFLAELQIVPEFQGRGLGSALLCAQLDQATLLRKIVTHRVLLENRAQSLYARFGFTVTARTDTHALMEWRPDTP